MPLFKGKLNFFRFFFNFPVLICPTPDFRNNSENFNPCIIYKAHSIPQPKIRIKTFSGFTGSIKQLTYISYLRQSRILSVDLIKQ